VKLSDVLAQGLLRKLKETLPLAIGSTLHSKEGTALFVGKNLMKGATDGGLAMTTLLLPSSILLLAVVDDLRSRKVHNGLTITAMIVALVFSIFVGGWSGFQTALLGGATALALCLPMFVFGVLGGGDVKLLIALGFATSSSAVFDILIYSLLWGALLGLTRIVISGESKQFFANLLHLALFRKSPGSKLHKIPYTVALLFAWLTHMSLNGWGM
jgi:prepilin peptidase CpaA